MVAYLTESRKYTIPRQLRRSKKLLSIRCLRPYNHHLKGLFKAAAITANARSVAGFLSSLPALTTLFSKFYKKGCFKQQRAVSGFRVGDDR